MVNSVTFTPETVQTDVVFDVKVTARPEVAVALSGGTVAAIVTLLTGPKVMVCEVCAVCEIVRSTESKRESGSSV